MEAEQFTQIQQPVGGRAEIISLAGWPLWQVPYQQAT